MVNEKILEENLLHYFSELKCWIDVFMNKLKKDMIREILNKLNKND